MKYNNHIILEGLWGVGKTRVLKELAKSGFTIIKEPIYYNKYKNNDKDRSLWYAKKHKDREKLILSELNPIALERSELSNFAYQYATKNKLPSKKDLSFLSKVVSLKKVLLVYLSINKNNSIIKTNDLMHGKEIKKITENKKRINLYEHWYKSILPEKFNLTLLEIDLINSARKTPNTISNEILKCLKSNRVAQVNIVVCRYNNSNELEVLVLKRAKDRGDFWQTITGGIHIGESFLHAGKRELKEELSIEVNKVSYADFSYSFTGNEGYKLNEYACFVLLNYKKSLNIKISDEHVEYKWLDPKSAMSLLKFKENKSAIKHSIKKIAPR
ncbi:MAG: NUDIX domain-containing protein [Candidatus Paceibacterota bacterium]